MPTLQIDRLYKKFGQKVAVADLSFEVNSGEIVGLLGPNGAGKSTTLQCAAGLLRPDSGSFSWNGLALGPERGQSIGLIPETPDVYPMLTAWEHLVFVAKSCKLGGDWQSKAETLFEQFEMNEHRNTLGQGLSKGMRQKTLIAATVLADAPVIFFDEPMVGLDPLGQRELRLLIERLKAQGTAIVICTHMLEQAKTISDRVVIMKDGRCVASGTFDELQATSGEHGTAEDMFLELTR
jgi:ABC-type multidrug transport system ATPase subunit